MAAQQEQIMVRLVPILYSIMSLRLAVVVVVLVRGLETAAAQDYQDRLVVPAAVVVMEIRVVVQVEQARPVRAVMVDPVELVRRLVLQVVAEHLQPVVLDMVVMEEQGLLHLYLDLPWHTQVEVAEEMNLRPQDLVEQAVAAQAVEMELGRPEQQTEVVVVVVVAAHQVRLLDDPVVLELLL